jgi:hypothetical protein
MNSELIIFTHSSYSDLWPPVKEHAARYIGDAIPKRFASDVPVGGCPTYLYTDEHTYPKRIIEALSQSTSKYVFLLHDIDLIMNFDVDTYNAIITSMDVNHVTRFSFEVFPFTTYWGRVGSLPIGKLYANCSRQFITPYDVGPSIWNRTELIEIMMQHTGETYRTIEESSIQDTCANYIFAGICDNNIELTYTIGRPFSSQFAFCHLLCRGKWICKEAQQSYSSFFDNFFTKFSIDPDSRGFMPYHSGMRIMKPS